MAGHGAPSGEFHFHREFPYPYSIEDLAGLLMEIKRRADSIDILPRF